MKEEKRLYKGEGTGKRRRNLKEKKEPERGKGTQDIDYPRTKKQLTLFLGTIFFYYKFVKNLMMLTATIFDLFKKRERKSGITINVMILKANKKPLFLLLILALQT